MSKQLTLDILISEMIEDFDRFGQMAEELSDRWIRYGNQFKDEITDEQRGRIEKAYQNCVKRLEKLGEES